MEVDINHFRAEIETEKVIRLDFGYVSNLIDNWWDNNKDKIIPIHVLKLKLIGVLLNHLKKDDTYYFNQVGFGGVAGVCITNVFNKDCPRLALIVHEALSDLFQLHDIKYRYEEHKTLYLKPTGEHYTNWGNGYGEITPHSDDLYEDLDTDYLSLTVCRDTTKTPTILYFLKDLIKNFNDLELIRLFNLKVKFISGKNVHIIKTRERNMLEYCPSRGFKCFLDFRVDKNTGERMTPNNKDDSFLLDKIKNNFSSCKFEESISATGTFLIVDNYKILHSRAQMNFDYQSASQVALNSDYSNTPRLLYRSKGPRKDYITFVKYFEEHKNEQKISNTGAWVQ